MQLISDGVRQLTCIRSQESVILEETKAERGLHRNCELITAKAPCHIVLSPVRILLAGSACFARGGCRLLRCQCSAAAHPAIEGQKS